MAAKNRQNTKYQAKRRQVMWSAGMPLPKFADRNTSAAIVTHFHFPVMPGTLATWPLVARKPNRAVIYEVEEVLKFAQLKVQQAPTYKQA